MSNQEVGQFAEANTRLSPHEDAALPLLRDFDFSQISFESDSMQVLSLSTSEKRIDFPLTQAPINFSILRTDGLCSNRWGVNTNRNGDAYVYCRDFREAEKISLHASGRQHISITDETAKRAGVESRFGPVWAEPEFERTAIPTFSLVFPPWGVGVRPEPRNFTKTELLIIGHGEKNVVVSFFIVDSAKTLQGRLPHFVLGKILLRPERILYVIAWKEPQKDFMDRVRRVFPQASQTFSDLGVGEGDYTLCVQGFREPNSAFMVTLPVHYTPAHGTD